MCNWQPVHLAIPRVSAAPSSLEAMLGQPTGSLAVQASRALHAGNAKCRLPPAGSATRSTAAGPAHHTTATLCVHGLPRLERACLALEVPAVRQSTLVAQSGVLRYVAKCSTCPKAEGALRTQNATGCLAYAESPKSSSAVRREGQSHRVAGAGMLCMGGRHVRPAKLQRCGTKGAGHSSMLV